MLRFILRRLTVIPFILLLANFGGFAYAYYVGPLQSIRNPFSFGLIQLPPFLPMYGGYLQRVLQLDFGIAPNNEPIVSLIGRTFAASAGLLLFSLALSVLVGLPLGFRAVRSRCLGAISRRSPSTLRSSSAPTTSGSENSDSNATTSAKPSWKAA